jgi:RNA polymerase sigma-70 factor (ECF subfamily)
VAAADSDALIGSQPGDPADIVTSRGSIRLAFIAALQYLPARQRAVLILRDVLAWRAAEVADLLGTSTVAVNSLLQRAKAQLEQAAPAEHEITEPGNADQRALLDQYVAALEKSDVTALMRLLREDAELEMPPHLTWFAGRDAVARFLIARTRGTRIAWRMVLTGANGQPTVATYHPEEDGSYRAHSIQVHHRRLHRHRHGHRPGRVVSWIRACSRRSDYRGTACGKPGQAGN